MYNDNRFLPLALRTFGVIVCLLYPLAMFWTSGWHGMKVVLRGITTS